MAFVLSSCGGSATTSGDSPCASCADSGSSAPGESDVGSPEQGSSGGDSGEAHGGTGGESQDLDEATGDGGSPPHQTCYESTVGWWDDPENPFSSFYDELARQPHDPDNLNQCMGLVDGSSEYRTYAIDDPYPKDGDPCPGAGNTPHADGSCVVPIGFERLGSAIGVRVCSCDEEVGLDCTDSLLPCVTLATATACDDSLGIGPRGTYAELLDETPCLREFDTCITPDLPASEGLACEWTTPKGCVCLMDGAGALVWQCESTRSWFDCQGDSCPWEAAELQSGADIKVNCSSCGAPTCLD